LTGRYQARAPSPQISSTLKISHRHNISDGLQIPAFKKVPLRAGTVSRRKETQEDLLDFTNILADLAASMKREKKSEKSLRDIEKVQEDLLHSQEQKLRLTRCKLKLTRERIAQTSTLWTKMLEKNKEEKEAIAAWAAECREDIPDESDSDSDMKDEHFDDAYGY
jgi:hypothetical protein